MSRLASIKRCLLLVALSAGIFLLAATPAGAQEKFQLARTLVKFPERAPVNAFMLQTDESRITFVPPAEAHVAADSTLKEVRVSFRDERCLILMRPSSVDPKFASPAKWEELRQMVQERFPKDEVSAASVCFSSVVSGGCGFTIERKTAYGMNIITRLSFLPVTDGMIEVSMSAVDSKYPSQEFKYNNFLNSLHVSKPVPEPSASVPQTGIANP